MFLGKVYDHYHFFAMLFMQLWGQFRGAIIQPYHDYKKIKSNPFFRVASQ